MKRTYLYLALAALALSIAGCKKIAEKIDNNLDKSMMASMIAKMRDFPYDVQRCDSIMRSYEFVADQVKEQGVTTWTREKCGTITRYKTQGTTMAISYSAEMQLDIYKPLHAHMWLTKMKEMMGNKQTIDFSATYDDQKVTSYSALTELLNNEPAQLMTVSDDTGRTKASFSIVPGTKSVSFRLHVEDYDLPIKK